MDNILGPDKQTFVREIVIISLSMSLNMCFGCSKEPSNWDVLLSIHKIFFDWKIQKITLNITRLSVGLRIIVCCRISIDMFQYTWSHVDQGTGLTP